MQIICRSMLRLPATAKPMQLNGNSMCCNECARVAVPRWWFAVTTRARAVGQETSNYIRQLQTDPRIASQACPSRTFSPRVSVVPHAPPHAPISLILRRTGRYSTELRVSKLQVPRRAKYYHPGTLRARHRAWVLEAYYEARRSRARGTLSLHGNGFNSEGAFEDIALRCGMAGSAHRVLRGGLLGRGGVVGERYQATCGSSNVAISR